MTESVYIPPDPALYDYVLDGFLTESRLLAKIARSAHFPQLIKNLSDFQNFIGKEAPNRFSSKLRTLVNDNNILDASDTDPELIELHDYANLAALCAVFQGWKLPIQQLEEKHLDQLVRQSVPAFHENDQEKATLLSDKLNGADTIRIVTMLRLFGLLPTDISQSHQLSLGAARGTRDLHSVHLVPEIEHSRPSVILKNPPPEEISFNTHLRKPQDVVMVDNHPAYHAFYDSLSSKWNDKVIGIHKGSYEALETFLSDERTSQLKPRDLIIAFRIDHRGFPDVEEFLRLLGPVIADTAHFIITMGSGHSLEEFNGRVNTMKTFNEQLQKFGLEPFHFVWHKGKNMEEKFHNPLFGSPAYASYETLYCKLDKQRLLA